MERKLDTNIDISKIADQLLTKEPTKEEMAEYQKKVKEWEAQPEKKRGLRPSLERKQMSGSEFFKSIIMAAINQTHKTGNIASLRRTRAISDLLDIAIESDGIVVVNEEDYKYMRSALSKADQWNNVESVAKSILAVDDVLNSAVEVE